MAEEVVEEEMERKAIESHIFGLRTFVEWQDSHGAYRLPRWSPVRGTPTVHETKAKFDFWCK